MVPVPDLTVSTTFFRKNFKLAKKQNVEIITLQNFKRKVLQLTEKNYSNQFETSAYNYRGKLLSTNLIFVIEKIDAQLLSLEKK